MQQQPAGASPDRRAHGGVLEVELRDRRRRGVRPDQRRCGVGVRLFLFVVLLCDRVRRRQLAIARRLARGALRLRQVAQQRSFALLERGAIGTSVDLEQHLAGSDLVALAKVDAQNRAVDLGEHVDRSDCFDRSGRGELVGHRAFFDAGHADRHSGRRGAAVGVARDAPAIPVVASNRVRKVTPCIRIARLRRRRYVLGAVFPAFPKCFIRVQRRTRSRTKCLSPKRLHIPGAVRLCPPATRGRGTLRQTPV